MSVVNIWSGAVGPTGATVVAKLSAGAATLLVADNPALSGAITVPPTGSSALLIDRFEIQGLEPDTQYWYAVNNDGVVDTAHLGRFHTHGPVGAPYSFTFAHATCAGSTTEYPTPGALAPRTSDHPVFDAIRQQDPQFFIHGGDLHYYDIGSGTYTPDASPDTYRRAYDDVLLSPRQQALYRNVPLVYMWSDHDFGPNDSDRTSPGRLNAAQVYRERVPHYPLAEGDIGTGAIYHSFQVGRVLFMVTDQRYYRDPPTQALPRTMMGAAQLSWMDNLLATSTADVLCWVQEQEYTATVTGTSFWGSYAAERSQITQMLGDHGWLNRMFMVCGDDHSMAMDTGANNLYGGFPLLMFSPMDSGMTGAPAYYDLGRRSVETGGTRGQWGTIQVFDPGPFIRITATGWWNS